MIHKHYSELWCTSAVLKWQRFKWPKHSSKKKKDLGSLLNVNGARLSPHTAMALAGKAYFDAVSKIGENAIMSPVSRELGEYCASSL